MAGLPSNAFPHDKLLVETPYHSTFQPNLQYFVLQQLLSPSVYGGEISAGLLPPQHRVAEG